MIRIPPFALWFLACAIGLTRNARGDEPAQVHAEELFRDGRQKLLDGKPDEACPLLQSSYDLDPGTGTLLALAICREREGRLATAWRGYKLVSERSKVDGRADREQAANASAAELEPQLSSVTLTLPEGWLKSTHDVRLSCDGVPIALADGGTSLPLDGGEHVLRLSARGRLSWETRLTVLSQGDRRTIAVPELPLEPPTPEPDRTLVPPSTTLRVAAPTEQRPISPKAPPETRLATLQTTAIAVGAAGLATMSVGAVFVVRALDKNADSNRGCHNDVCTPSAKADRMEARFSGDVATVSFVTGGALVGAGALLFAVGNDSSHPPRAPRRGQSTSPQVSISICPFSREIVLKGNL